MISYIDEYNDNVEKQCIIKNNKNKKKQRNGLLNPNLKFSSSLNAFIPPPNSDSPKINKSDFINIMKSSFKTLGKDPPADEELEDIFMNMSELDILEFNNNLTEIDIAEFNIDMPLQVGVDVEQGFYNPESLMGMSVEAQKSRQKMLRAEEILREFSTMEGFNNEMPLQVGVDAEQGFYSPESLMGLSQGAGSSKSMLSRTAQLISDFDARDAPPTASPIRNINLTTEKSPPSKILTRKEAQKSGLLLSDKNLTMSQQFEEAAKRGVRTAKQEAVKALNKMGFANQKEYWKSRIEAHSNPLVSGRISKQPEGNTSAQSPEPEGLYDSGDMTLPFY